MRKFFGGFVACLYEMQSATAILVVGSHGQPAVAIDKCSLPTAVYHSYAVESCKSQNISMTAAQAGASKRNRCGPERHAPVVANASPTKESRTPQRQTPRETGS